MGGLALWPRVRAVAYSFRDFTEQSTNQGQVVDRFIAHVGLNPTGKWPWCAAYVFYVGYYGLFDPVSQKSAWPLPKTAGCKELGVFAERKGILKEEAQAGDVFLAWYTFKDQPARFAHTGFLIHRNPDGSWLTLEGNTSKPGDTDPKTAREGWGVFQRTRVLKPKDRAIRWTDLL